MHQFSCYFLSSLQNNVQDNKETLRISLFAVLSREMLESIQGVVEFAKGMPGFTSLPQDDQLILIKTGFFEVWALHTARLTTKETVMLSDGLIINRKHFETVYSVSDLFEPIVFFIVVNIYMLLFSPCYGIEFNATPAI